ncbi:SsgA family sporulation/cell division regulator [Streptomyces sp. SID5785]|uniref:SsgA family sporulation/cell division regulator n=1 Tax=Streptomyces sp. SID5785 TaxID=2690309 RepID=UPI001360F892|nr:SsgA family sporulation/cell division regulator [Streptomyces sp. SID5785]
MTPHRSATLKHDAALLREGLSGLPSAFLGLELHYTALDPFAVRITLEVDGASVRWVLSREMFVQALDGLAGDGDVAAWPVLHGAGAPDTLRLRLGPADGYAVLEADHDVVATWLNVTLRLVPPGTEEAYIDWDGFLTDLAGDV